MGGGTHVQHAGQGGSTAGPLWRRGCLASVCGAALVLLSLHLVWGGADGGRQLPEPARAGAAFVASEAPTAATPSAVPPAAGVSSAPPLLTHGGSTDGGVLPLPYVQHDYTLGGDGGRCAPATAQLPEAEGVKAALASAVQAAAAARRGGDVVRHSAAAIGTVTCQALAGEGGTYGVTVCVKSGGGSSSSGRAAGWLVVTEDARHVGDLAALARARSADAGYRRRMREACGGDGAGASSFKVRLVGEREVVSLAPSAAPYDGGDGRKETFGCFYVFPFEVCAGEAYRVEAEVLYEHYEAFNEAAPDTPPLVRRHLLPVAESRDNKGKVIAGAQHHDPAKNLWHFDPANDPAAAKLLRSSRFRTSKAYVWDQFTLAARYVFNSSDLDAAAAPAVPRLGLPACKGCGGGLIPGRWTRVGSAPQPSSDEAAHTHFERFFPRALYGYAPLGCALRAVSEERARECLRGKRVAFTGDSHQRVTFTFLANLLIGRHNATHPPLDPEVKRMDGVSLHGVGHGTSLLLKNDIYLAKHDLRRLAEQHDVVVAGFGSWALGGGGKDPKGKVLEDVGRWRNAAYAAAVEERVARLAAGKTKGNRLVWSTMPAYPINQRRFAKLKGEYRTNPRIELFNEAAVEAAGRHAGVDVLDSFSPSLPMAHLSLDHNHHVGVVQHAIVHHLLNILCGDGN